MDKVFNLLICGDAGKKEKEFLEKKVKRLKVTLAKEVSPQKLLSAVCLSDLLLVFKNPNFQTVNLAFKELVPIVGVGEVEIEGIGLVLKDKELPKIAALTSLLLRNRALRRKLVEYQMEKLKIEPKVFFQIEGSFDSSYSLAIVNREMARALNRIFPERVSLYSTDGYGDFPPKKSFLKANPDVAKMHSLSRKHLHAPVVLRNPYPPRVWDMKGLINAMTSYGWEESEYPKEYLEDFNRYLDLLPVMSPYVEKVMIDNGIEVPVFVVGLGVDHLLRVKPEKYPLKTKKSFKFLHISSCFPRKGVDVLIDAYTSEFTGSDDVVLIIKTFPNPHNNVEELVKKFTKGKKNPPEIEVINKDIPDSQVAYLYTQADCFVLPSRGEGFGMPAAEAMLHKVPVITTGYSGQTYFCNEETAFLVDFHFERSRSHLSTPFSYWVTPDKEDLSRKMRTLFEKRNSEEVKKKVEKAYNLIVKEFTWEKAAYRLLKGIETVKRTPLNFERKLKLALLTTWNVRCGIASYSKFLAENFSEKVSLSVLANQVPSSSLLNEKEEEKVFRLWEIGFPERSLKKVLDFLREEKPDALLIQHHFALFKTKTLKLLLREAENLGVYTFLTFHTTYPPREKFIREMAGELSLLKRVFVHSIKDLNNLKRLGISLHNLSLLPHGIKESKVNEENVKKLKEIYKLKNSFVIGTFGFLREHKGTLKLLKVFPLLKEKFKNLKLLLLTPIYPSSDSEEFYIKLKSYIETLPCRIKGDIVFITEFVPEEFIGDYLSLMDLIVLPYNEVGESSSAAVRHALSVKRPVLTTPATIFEDLKEYLLQTEDFSEESLFLALNHLLSRGKEELEEKRRKVEELLKVASWKAVSKRVERIISYFVFYRGKT